MSNFKILMYLFISSLLLISVSSCDKDEVNFEEMDPAIAIVGKWELIAVDLNEYMDVPLGTEPVVYSFGKDKRTDLGILSHSDSKYLIDANNIYVELHPSYNGRYKYDTYKYSFSKDRLRLVYQTKDDDPWLFLSTIRVFKKIK